MKDVFINHKLDNMSLSDKIGQLLMIDYRNLSAMNADFETILKKYNPGGFVIFKSNVINFKQTQKLIRDIKDIINIPCIISTDQEGGRVQRLDKRVGFKQYPPMLEIGKTLSEKLAFDVGYKMGNDLKSIGIDMTMAPVLDIYSNPDNKVISDRAFGTTPNSVSKLALIFASGLKKANVISVGKHFPGHGDTSQDSHIDLPIIDKTLEQLKNLELIPFQNAITNLLPCLMVAHIACPNVTNNMMPASLSKIMIQNILRENMGYKGIVIPDSLQMKALTKYYDEKKIYFNCIDAGNDFLLMPQNISLAYQTIYQHVNEGNILIEQIDNSVYRILSLKFDYGLFKEEYQDFKRNYRCRILKK